MPAAASAHELAEEALRLVGIDARAAEVIGEAAVAAAKAEHNVSAQSLAWRARGLAARENEQLPLAEQHLRRAVAVARRGGGDRVGEAQMSLAFVLLERGKLPGARRAARVAVETLTGPERARARVQLALVEQRTGATAAAFVSYEQALVELKRVDDSLWAARLHNNRGVLHAYQGNAQAADKDLSRAAELYETLGQQVMAGEARWNLGFAAGLRGDIVLALQWFETAGAQLASAGALRSVSFPDQGLVLLAAGLLDDARRAIDTGIVNLTAADVASDVAEAHLLLSETMLALGDPAAARSAAQSALRAFEAQGRRRHTLLAQLALLQAADEDDALWAGGAALVHSLQEAGWGVAAIDVTLLLAHRAVGRGEELDPEVLAVSSAAARRGSLAQRMRAWHLLALVRLSHDDARGAAQALRAGLRVHDRHRTTLSATELQVRTSARARQLAETGLRLAARDGRPAQILAWAERWRAGSLLARPVTAPSDAVLASRLTELRAVTAELQEAWLAGDDTARLERRQKALERSVSERARAIRTELEQAPIASASVLTHVLGDRVLLEYVDLGGELVAVVVRSGRTTLHRLGSTQSAHRALEALQFALRRLAQGGSARMMTATEAALAAAAEQLDALLLAPLAAKVSGRQLVMVPTGALHALPWSLLRHARDLPLTVVPSASVWLDAQTRSGRTSGHVLLVAGPDLTGAEDEVAVAASTYAGEAEVLTGAGASVTAVLGRLEGCSSAHIAAHGSFRSDNPLFSSLRMADGSITVYDLETLSAAPPLVVLSACDSGLSMVHPGDELMGLTSALLRMGTASLVASVAPVPDDVSRDTMVRFHAELVGGTAVAEALLAAREQLTAQEQLRAAAFVCLGAGC